MTYDDIFKLMAKFLVLIVFVAAGLNFWWMPQKWQGCQKIYDNRPAQIMCLLSK